MSKTKTSESTMQSNEKAKNIVLAVLTIAVVGLGVWNYRLASQASEAAQNIQRTSEAEKRISDLERRLDVVSTNSVVGNMDKASKKDVSSIEYQISDIKGRLCHLEGSTSRVDCY